MHTDAFVAATRFGLGPRSGELPQMAADPRGWLLAQLTGPDPVHVRLTGEQGSADVLVAFSTMRMASDLDKGMFRRQRQDMFQREMAARCEAAVLTDAPFRERWVRFWSNHFTVSTARKEVLPLAGPFEREAIRPHCTGRFVDLLTAVELHPAMLLYLDNVRSVGPNSRAGTRGRGLNENLARETLELHTLGVDGGYDQADVEALARLLTGWTVEPERGVVQFTPGRHEPGRKILLGTTHPEGSDGIRSALADLAARPATAIHIATRLARHFVADDPPSAAVHAIATTFRDTDGDLSAVAAAVVGVKAAWEPLTKVKSPDDLVLSTARALDYASEGEAMLRSLRWLGQEPFSASSPQGFPDTAAGWLGPEALLSRIEWAEEVADQAHHRVDALTLADDVLGPVLDRATRAAVASASPRDGLALLLASPTFQRR
ncbi:MAG: hypothetical protein ACI8PZ_001290 [Myxococcota bacterium]|jgi:uncharacterized protein (DUF1800 family)